MANKNSSSGSAFRARLRYQLQPLAKRSRLSDLFRQCFHRRHALSAHNNFHRRKNSAGMAAAFHYIAAGSGSRPISW